MTAPEPMVRRRARNVLANASEESKNTGRLAWPRGGRDGDASATSVAGARSKPRGGFCFYLVFNVMLDE